MAFVPYLHAISTTTQTVTTADTPQLIDIDVEKLANDITLNLETNTVKLTENGIYYVSIVAQVGREDTCSVDVPNMRFFVKKNGTEINDSNSLVNVNRHRETKAPYSKDFLCCFAVDDELTFFVSSSVDALTKLEYTDLTGEPDVPSFSVTIFKMGTDGESECL